MYLLMLITLLWPRVIFSNCRKIDEYKVQRLGDLKRKYLERYLNIRMRLRRIKNLKEECLKCLDNEKRFQANASLFSGMIDHRAKDAKHAS